MNISTQKQKDVFSLSDISFSTPYELGLDFKTYSCQVNALIQKQLDLGRATVALRPLDKLKKQYAYSIVACLQSGDQNNLIAHASLLPTDQIDSSVDYQRNSYAIGELESVVVDPELQVRGIGKELLHHTHQHFSHQFAAVIMATLEPKMRHLTSKYFNYEDQHRLPNSFYEEGKKFFVDTGKMSLEEFEQDGTSMLRFGEEVVNGAKQYITQLFLDS